MREAIKVSERWAEIAQPVHEVAAEPAVAELPRRDAARHQ
jgi:hypothetical protein